MIPFLRVKYGNPSSIYSLGEEITDAIEEARDKVANLINAREHELIFTSGGTESTFREPICAKNETFCLPLTNVSVVLTCARLHAWFL